MVELSVVPMLYIMEVIPRQSIRLLFFIVVVVFLFSLGH